MILLVLLTILLGSYAGLSLLDRLGWMRTAPGRRGRVSLALLFMVTSLGHFAQTAQMAEMLPARVPNRDAIVYVTGVLEAAGALGLLVPRFSRLAGICLLLFLIAVFPANVYAAFARAPMGGHDAGPVYLLVRGPFQLLLVWWTWRFAVRGSQR
jgi:uncharacterized membrane protein